MEIRIPYEVVKEAVDKAGNPEEPGTAIVIPVWTPDDEYEIVIERPKEWLHPFNQDAYGKLHIDIRTP